MSLKTIILARLLIVVPPLCRNQATIGCRGWDLLTSALSVGGLERKMISRGEAGTQSVSLCVPGAPNNCLYSQPRPHCHPCISWSPGRAATCAQVDPISALSSSQTPLHLAAAKKHASLFRRVRLSDERQSARMQINTYTFGLSRKEKMGSCVQISMLENQGPFLRGCKRGTLDQHAGSRLLGTGCCLATIVYKCLQEIKIFQQLLTLLPSQMYYIWLS